MRKIAQIFVAFSEKLNFTNINSKTKYLFYIKNWLKNESPQCTKVQFVSLQSGGTGGFNTVEVIFRSIRLNWQFPPLCSVAIQ